MLIHSTGRPLGERSARATQLLREYILEAGLKNGDQLLAERLLAPLLGISRGALRQALATAEAAGEVWRHVGKGTFVSTSRQVPGCEFVDQLARNSHPMEVIETRATLEPRLAALAALRGTPRAIAELKLIVRMGLDAADVATSHRHGSDFHHAIARMGGNQLLLGLFEAVFQVRDLNSWGKLKASAPSLDDMRRLWEHHALIAEAIVQRDAHGAEALMRQHIDQLHHAISAQDARIDASRFSRAWAAALQKE